jgi:hypothetical protein
MKFPQFQFYSTRQVLEHLESRKYEALVSGRILIPLPDSHSCSFPLMRDLEPFCHILRAHCLSLSLIHNCPVGAIIRHLDDPISDLMRIESAI